MREMQERMKEAREEMEEQFRRMQKAMQGDPQEGDLQDDFDGERLAPPQDGKAAPGGTARIRGENLVVREITDAEGKTTITKILTAREYIGDIVNFKTYSKSFKNKQRMSNPEENWAIFEGVHEPIIDKERWEMVQRIRDGIKRRQPKTEHRNMFSGLLYCADCGSKLHYNVNHPSTHLSYFNCSNYRGNRGTCNETHYIRVDALTEVVLAELHKLVCYVQSYESEGIEGATVSIASPVFSSVTGSCFLLSTKSLSVLEPV